MSGISDRQGRPGAPGFLDRMRGGGACPPRRSLRDLIGPWIASLVGVSIAALPSALLNLAPTPMIGLIGSFGASGVLLYGLPRAEAAQPRSVVVGHAVGATAGVVAFTLMPDGSPPSALCAVAWAVAAMYLARALHPPAVATALIAVTGGPSVHALGMFYVVAPVLAGAVAMVAVALVVNNLTHDSRRNYPVYWW